MNTDELRHALDDLAGDPPPVDDAFDRVTVRAHRGRLRTRAGALAVVVCLIATAGVGVSRHTSSRHLTVTNPPAPSIGNVAGFSWTRVAGPPIPITRIVSANGHTFALANDNTSTAGAAIYELTTGGQAREILRRPYAKGFTFFNDLIEVRGALVAVGQTNGAAAAWRSTDNGATWRSVPVEQPPSSGPPPTSATSVAGTGGVINQSEVSAVATTIYRVIESGGVLDAFGRSGYTPPGSQCAQGGWTSTDGTRFDLAPPGSPIACGGSDAADGPAGVVAIANEPTRAISIVDRTKFPMGTGSTVNGIAGGTSGYVAVGVEVSAVHAPFQIGAIWWSPDAQTWTRVVTANLPGFPRASSTFTSVAHTQAGWIAIGSQTRDPNAKGVTDALLWTSTDGEHWTEDRRDNQSFEQYASAGEVGGTPGGFVIAASNLKGEDINGFPLGAENVLWLGSATPPARPVGIIEGTLEEIGGPRPLLRPVAGKVSITAGGHTVDVTTGPDGWYSVEEPPGGYQLVGRSPDYESGAADCVSQIVGSDQPGDPITARAGLVTHVDLMCQVK